MSESQQNSTTWIQDWIEEQRKKLNQSSEEATSGRGSQGDSGATPGWGEFLSSLGASFENHLNKTFKNLGPPLGWLREHEQAWRDLASAQASYRVLEAELGAMIRDVQQEALSLLEKKLRGRAGREPVTNIRELYDLWVQCGEDSYARLAHGEAYCSKQAAFANAAIALRSKQQELIERGLKLFDLPTRSELNSVHRQVRELRDRIEQLGSAQHSGKGRRASGRASHIRKRAKVKSRAKGRRT